MLPFTRKMRGKASQQHMPPIPDRDTDDEDENPSLGKRTAGTNTTVIIQNLRTIVRSYMDSHRYEAALFWADKVVSLSDDQAIDVFWLAQSMYYLKQYHRAAFCIQSRGLHKTYLICRYLAAKCLMEAKEYTSALILLFPEPKVKSSPTDGSKSPARVVESKRSNTAKVLFTERLEPSSLGKRPGESQQAHSSSSTSENPLSSLGTSFSDVVDTNLLPDLPSNRLDGLFSNFGNGSMFPTIDSPDSAILFLKGCVYEALDNRSLATECFKVALIRDVHCYDAFEALVNHQMLSACEEKELMGLLPFSIQCKCKAEETFVRSIYESLLKKYHSVPTKSSVKIHPRLRKNLDMEAAIAERNYYACAFSECYAMTTKILLKDPYHSACLPIHIACLVQLKKGNDLFQLAHELLDLRPDLAVSWFAVGCYYYLKGKIDPARRYLDKATTIDKLFGPAWLAYGHTFAVENEHDQAMAAYFKASQLMKGCHLPLLYIGLECGLTTNFKLADKFLSQAKAIAPSDPFVLHEMGVVAYQKLEFERAEKLFEEALEKIREVNEPVMTFKWEPLYNNLGHTCRKLKKYEKALEYYHQAMILSPYNPSTYASIGFVQALTGKLSEASESFHKSLVIRRDDAFSTTMLTFVMEQLGQEPFPTEDGELLMPAPATTSTVRQGASSVKSDRCPGKAGPEVKKQV